MRRLALFVAVVVALLAVVAATDWWVDPFGQVWKPEAVAEARAKHCLVSQELIGSRYLAFKLDVFRHRPTRTFVVGSSRVLKLQARPGEQSFANLGYPGTSPETIRRLFRLLPAAPKQTVYLGVEGFWFNRAYRIPDTGPSAYTLAQYLLSRNAFDAAVRLVRQASYIGTKRWHTATVGPRCTIARTYPSVNWQLDGSRVWSWEIDPARYPKFHATPFTGDLAAWRNGYYADWQRLEPSRLAALRQALALARERGWRVIGFAPPEPAPMLRLLDRDARLAPPWREFLATMPHLFGEYGFPWLGLAASCPTADFPDAFHTDAVCSARVRSRLDEAARRLH